jgi:hypothetical protein
MTKKNVSCTGGRVAICLSFYSAFHSVIKEGWAIENILYSTIRNLK